MAINIEYYFFAKIIRGWFSISNLPGGNYYKYKGYGAGGNFSLIILSEP
jgi:hypothetical protein